MASKGASGGCIVMPSTTKNNRKASKPLMEKRRRARINRSLSELKDLIVCSDQSEIENSRRSKLEKADILEMTVQHLHKIHLRDKNDRDLVETRQEESCDDSDSASDDLEKFRAGFHECVLEVTRYLAYESAPFDVVARSRLTDHLNTCAQRILKSGSQSPPHKIENPSPSTSPKIVTSQQHRRQQRHHPYHSDGSTSPSQLRPDSTTVTTSNRVSPVMALESPPSSSSFHSQEPDVAVDMPNYRQNRPSLPTGYSGSRGAEPPSVSFNDGPFGDRLTKGVSFGDYRALSGKRLLSHNVKQAAKRDLKSVLRLPQHLPTDDVPVWRPW